MDTDDATLVRRYNDGDSGALEQLVERYRRPLFHFILNMLNGQGEADEIFQEVWFRVIRNVARYRDQGFLSWLFRIAHNLMVDRFRWNKGWGWVSADRENAEGISIKDVAPDPGPTPDEQVGASESEQRVWEAVARLPPEQREVFILRMAEDLAFKEIASIQRVSINTALARMQYAVTKLREALKEDRHHGV